MTTLDELVVRIKADASQLERGLSRVGATTQQATSRMGSAFGLLKAPVLALGGALAAIQFTGLARDALAAAGAMQDLADRIGTSASFLSAMEMQAGPAGASVQDVAAAVQFMNNSVGGAAKGNEQMIDAFRRLNIGVEELKRLSPEDQFYLIAQRISELGTQFEQVEAARNIFGRGVGNLIPVIKQGGDELKAMNEQLVEQGLALSADQIGALDEFGDAMARAGAKIKNQFVGAMAEALIALQRFTGEVGAMGTTAISREIEEAEKTLAEVEALRASGQGPRDRLGNQVDTTASARKRLEELRAAYNKTQTQGYGPDPARPAATPASGGGSGKKTTRAAVIREEARATEELSAATDDLIRRFEQEQDAHARAQAEVRRQTEMTARVVKDYIGDAFESALFDAENFGDAVSGILDGIAWQIARKGIIDPLSSGISDAIGGSGLFDSLGSVFGGFFADGGRPPRGKVSVVGEAGPELFVPDSAGTIIPNHAMGGSSTRVTHVWNMQGGVTRQELAELIPAIERRASAATLAAIERGGAAARAVNRRQ